MPSQDIGSQFAKYAKPRSSASIKLGQLRQLETAFKRWKPAQNRLVVSLPKVNARQADVLKQQSDFERYRAASQKDEENVRKELIVALQRFVAGDAVMNDKVRNLQQRAHNQLALLQGKEEGNKALREGALLNEMLIESCLKDLTKLKNAEKVESPRKTGVKRSGTNAGAWWAEQ